MLNTAALIDSGQPFDQRAGDPRLDAVDGVVPQIVVSPHTAAAVAATLEWASGSGLSVLIRGAGSKTGWGATPRPIDVLLEMSRLNRILAHRKGDLTVQVESGARLSEVNRALLAHGQWLALDPPFERAATIGGLLATNDSGPQRHRFGTPRDLVIGTELATPDGRLTKAGGQVVKNVAGYDLSKLISGSFGSLAAIVSATFKLAPVPAASSTIVVKGLEPGGLVRLVEAIAASQLEPVAFEVHVQRLAAARPTASCMIRFASFAAVVESEVANAAGRVASVHDTFDVLTGDAEVELWRAHGERLWSGAGAIVRASWLPGNLSLVLPELDALAAISPVEMIGRAGIGAGLLRLDGEDSRQLAAIGRLRASSVLGNVVVVRAPAGLKSRDSVWGPRRNASLQDAIKQQLDPRGILGAGRGPV